MGAYTPNRLFGLVIYTDDYKGEAHRSYVYNSLGWKVSSGTADYLQSKTQSPNLATKLARELMEQSEVLGNKNVEILSNNVSKSSPKMLTFNTLCQTVNEAFPRLTEEQYGKALAHLVRFVDVLSRVRPKEIAVLEASQRQSVRETKLADHPVLWSAYMKLAARIFESEPAEWEKLLASLSPDAANEDFLALENPVWSKGGVVAESKQGLRARNNTKTRKASYEILCEKLGIEPISPAAQSKKFESNGPDSLLRKRLMPDAPSPKQEASACGEEMPSAGPTGKPKVDPPPSGAEILQNRALAGNFKQGTQIFGPRVRKSTANAEAAPTETQPQPEVSRRKKTSDLRDKLSRASAGTKLR